MPALSKAQLLALARLDAAGGLNWVDGFGARISSWRPPLTISQATARRLASDGLITNSGPAAWTATEAGAAVLAEHPAVREVAVGEDLARNPARAHHFLVHVDRWAFMLEISGDSARDRAEALAERITDALGDLHGQDAAAFARAHRDMTQGRESAIALAGLAVFDAQPRSARPATLQLRCILAPR